MATHKHFSLTHGSLSLTIAAVAAIAMSSACARRSLATAPTDPTVSLADSDAESAGSDAVGMTPPANAPVAPEAIYVGISGSTRGISIIDCNGFGQGTGDPAISNFPNNPNVGVPAVAPQLAPGTSTLDGGGAGFLTWTTDTVGSKLLGDSVSLSSVTSLVLGQPLDLEFNNLRINPSVTEASHVNPTTFQNIVGNCIESAPHPNPPRLLAPTPVPFTQIAGEEPTVTSSTGPIGEVTTTTPPCRPSPANRLVPGDPFSTQPGTLGLFASNHPGVFVGPQLAPPSPPPPTPFCPYTIRQQIGHYLYALDPKAGSVLVLNSNRCTQLAQLVVPGACEMAISPDLRLLAVTSRATDSVHFIDTDPLSVNFHRTVAVTAVGRSPCALAWQPEGEALFVCNERSSSVSILDGTSLQVTRTLQRFLFSPREIAISARQDGLGLGTGSYYAFIRNALGLLVVYESASSSGGGVDDVRIPLPLVWLSDAASLQIDMASLAPAFWVAQRARRDAEVRRYELQPGRFGPTLRHTSTIGGRNPTTPVATTMSGRAVVDIAFDDVRNRGALTDRRSFTLPRSTLQHSNKGIVKVDGTGYVTAHQPGLLFVGYGDTGKVDVIELETGALLRTLDAPGVRCLGNYFHQ